MNSDSDETSKKPSDKSKSEIVPITTGKIRRMGSYETQNLELSEKMGRRSMMLQRDKSITELSQGITAELHRVRKFRFSLGIGKKYRCYELIVDNKSDFDIETFTYAVPKEGADEQPMPHGSRVDARTLDKAQFDVQLPSGQRDWRVISEIRSYNATIVIQETPAKNKKNGLNNTFILLLIFIGIFSAYSWHEGQPSLTILVPPTTLKNQPFDIRYSLRNTSRGRYEIMDQNNISVASGSIISEDGDIRILLPKSKDTNVYKVRLAAINAIGSNIKESFIAELDPTPLAVIKKPIIKDIIGKISADKESVESGKNLLISYNTGLKDGEVRLIDQLGTIRSEALVNPNGNSLLIVPSVAVDQDFKVVVTSGSGIDITHQEMAVRIIKATTTPPPSASPTLLNLASNLKSIRSGPIILEGDHFYSNSKIKIQIASYSPGMQIILTNTTGTEISSLIVNQNDRIIQLTLPAVSESSKYTLTTTYQRGTEEETAIQSIIITPHINNH